MQLSDEQNLIRDTARQFAQAQLQPHAARWAEESHFPAEAISALGELGFMGLLIPEAWGGAELDYMSYVLAIEEIARGDAACATILSVHNSVASLPLYHFGSDAQKEKFLRPMAQGKALGAFCLTEPQAGSDAANIQTQAILEGSEYCLKGTKQFVTSGKSADFAIVIAKTDLQAGKQGMSAFIVPTDHPGYQVVRIEEKMGQSAAETAQVLFEDCKVSAEYLLGKPGEGYKIALSQLESGRLGIAAQAVGIAQAAFEGAQAYARDRKSFGKALLEHQAISFRLADMATQVEAARQLVWHAASSKDAGMPCLQLAAMAKLFATEMAEKVCRQALQIHGGYGYLKDFPIERLYRDARATSIYEGTSDIQRMLIARELS